MLILILGVILVALVFEYINGFHDTANSIATTVSTKVLTPRQAIIWAATFNLIGALWGTAVATTIGKGMVDTHFVTTQTILSALLAAIVWNLLTWWLGLPSSSSHALVGGLCGQHHGHQQLIGRGVFEFAFRLRVRRSETGKELANFLRAHAGIEVT